MPLVDLVDDTFVVAHPRVVAAVVADPARWAAWWPELVVTVERDRGTKGVQWVARSVGGTSRPLLGTLEVWLEPWGDGVLLHHYARLDAHGWREGEAQQRRWADRERDRMARRWKGHVHALKDELEAGRPPGEPRRGLDDTALDDGALDHGVLDGAGSASAVQGRPPTGR